MYQLEGGNGGAWGGDPVRGCRLLGDPWFSRCCLRYGLGEIFKSWDIFVVNLKPLGVYFNGGGELPLKYAHGKRQGFSVFGSGSRE